MTLSRNITLFIHFLFDQLIPPLLRDSKWFMWLPFKLLFRKKAKIFFEFKNRAPYLSGEAIREIYREVSDMHIQRETDLNQACLQYIENNIAGNTVLDIACGRGFLSQILAKKYQVTAADIVIDPDLIAKYPNIQFQESSLESMPFADHQFDTVICTHTIEHVQDIHAAIFHLRRVYAQRLIIVVPKQQPYKYTFDLHLHFFPYASDFLMTIGTSSSIKQSFQSLGGDWLYIEERQ